MITRKLSQQNVSRGFFRPRCHYCVRALPVSHRHRFVVFLRNASAIISFVVVLSACAPDNSSGLDHSNGENLSDSEIFFAPDLDNDVYNYVMANNLDIPMDRNEIYSIIGPPSDFYKEVSVNLLTPVWRRYADRGGFVFVYQKRDRKKEKIVEDHIYSNFTLLGIGKKDTYTNGTDYFRGSIDYYSKSGVTVSYGALTRIAEKNASLRGKEKIDYFLKRNKITGPIKKSKIDVSADTVTFSYKNHVISCEVSGIYRCFVDHQKYDILFVKHGLDVISVLGSGLID